MQPTERHTAHGDEEEEEEEEVASEDAPSCQFCHPTTGVTVAVVTLLLLTAGLLLCLAITFVTCSAAPEALHASSREELMERLGRCEAERHRADRTLQEVTQDPRCGLCPGGWRWWRRRCYFFSVGLEENLQWGQSQEFCRRRNGSLAVIGDSAEMGFLQGVMSGFPTFPFLWVGLTDAQQEGRWLWVDGTGVRHHMALTVEWDTDNRDCADLRGYGRLFASDCDSYGPWVCERES